MSCPSQVSPSCNLHTPLRQTKIFHDRSSFPLTTESFLKHRSIRSKQMLQRSFSRKFNGVERLEKCNRIRLRSFKGTHWYNISVNHKTCDCRVFDTAKGCEHLTALGLHRVRYFSPTAHPSSSQALSALVKSIRIRRIEDAVYWLLYLDTFKEPQYRFRTARRLLIGSAEDGDSVAVMEEIGRKFWKLCKPAADLIELVSEAIRICKLPNWWHPDSGGPDYIYQSLVGQRAWFYKAWDQSLTAVQNDLAKAIAERNRAVAIGAVMAFGEVRPVFGATKQAELLLECAERLRHDLAATKKFARPVFSHLQRPGFKHADAASRDLVERRCGIQKFGAAWANILASSRLHRRLDGFCNRHQAARPAANQAS